MIILSRFGCLRGMVLGLAVLGFVGTAQAQQPTPSAIATAKALLVLKGANNMYDPVFIGIIEKAKYTFLQTNPALSKDLNEVAAQLRTEYEPRLNDLMSEVAKMYASRFTEPELNQALAFYKSPLGMKLIQNEPKILDESMNYAANWANKLADEVLAKMSTEMKKRGHDL